MTYWHSTLFFLATLASATTCLSKDVILHLAPAEDAPIVAHISANSPQAKAARPVLEAEKARLGWMWLEYTATLEGYIPTRSLSKNFEVEPGTLVRAGPNRSSTVLTSIATGDQLQITASNDNWSTLRFRKPVPVYFNQQVVDTRPALPELQQAQPIPFDPNAKVANIAPNQLKPENVIWRTAPANTPIPKIPERTVQQQPSAPQKQATQRPSQTIMTGSALSHQSELPRQPETLADAQLGRLNGTLIREIENSGLHYPIRLIMNSGNRTVYVDLSQLFVNDLRPYLNHKVQIIGEIRQLAPGSQDLIIQARTIRLAQ